MGKGRYHGGSTIIHAGIGYVSPEKSIKIGIKNKTKKRNREINGIKFHGYLTLKEAQNAGLSRKQWQIQCNAHVNRLEKELAVIKTRITHLKNELIIAERARQAAFQVDGQIRHRSGVADGEDK